MNQLLSYPSMIDGNRIMSRKPLEMIAYYESLKRNPDYNVAALDELIDRIYVANIESSHL